MQRVRVIPAREAGALINDDAVVTVCEAADCDRHRAYVVFEPASGAWGATVIEGGRLRGNLAGKNADYDITVEQYNQLLADALRDVVDQLTSWKSVEEQRREQTKAIADA